MMGKISRVGNVDIHVRFPNGNEEGPGDSPRFTVGDTHANQHD